MLVTEWYREVLLSLLQNGTGRCYLASLRLVQEGVIKLVTEWYRDSGEREILNFITTK